MYFTLWVRFVGRGITTCKIISLFNFIKKLKRSFKTRVANSQAFLNKLKFCLFNFASSSSVIFIEYIPNSSNFYQVQAKFKPQLTLVGDPVQGFNIGLSKNQPRGLRA